MITCQRTKKKPSRKERQRNPLLAKIFPRRQLPRTPLEDRSRLNTRVLKRRSSGERMMFQRQSPAGSQNQHPVVLSGQDRAVAGVRVAVFFEAPAFLPVFLSELIRFDLGVESRTDPAVHAVFREVRDRVDGIITRAMEREQLRSADPYFLQHVFMGVINAVLRTAAQDLSREDIPRCVELVMQTFLEGVETRGGS